MPTIDCDIASQSKQTDCELNRDTVLFVCTGNTCRSPMCAALFNSKYAGLTHHALSAGLFADRSPISENAVFALESMGVRKTSDNDYSAHVSHTVTEADLENSTLVVGVSSSHALNLIMRFPQYASKITSLPIEISDPYGGDIDDYKMCLFNIDKALGIMFGQDKIDED